MSDKKYADFRNDYSAGFQQVLDAIAKITSETQGRYTSTTSMCDWAFDWGYSSDLLTLIITIVEHSDRLPFCVLTEISISANSSATVRHKQYVDAGLDWYGRHFIIEVVGTIVDEDRENCRVLITDDKPSSQTYYWRDSKSDKGFDINVRCRRLGDATEQDTIVDWGNQFIQFLSSKRGMTRKLTSAETKALFSLLVR